jgi:hypothetical protein
MSRPTLLVVDYPGRRDEARIVDLALDEAGYDLTLLLQPPFPQAPDAASFAGSLAGRFGPFGPGVAAVLAYCMAAPIAHELSAALGVPLILLDGEPSTSEAVERELGVAMAQIGRPRDARDSRGRFPSATLRAEPEGCVRRMSGILTALAATALREEEPEAGEAEVAAEAARVAGFYLDWLAYLVAGHNADWPRLSAPVLHVVSRTHTYLGDWPGAPRTVRSRVDADRNDLCHRPESRDLILAFLKAPVMEWRPIP